jgi:hypothetical protein
MSFFNIMSKIAQKIRESLLKKAGLPTLLPGDRLQGFDFKL